MSEVPPDSRIEPTSLVKVEPKLSVDDEQMQALAERAREQCQQVDTALRTGVRHAVAAGRSFIEAKRKLRHGKFEVWLKLHVHVKLRTAQLYMQLSRGVDALSTADAQRVASLSLREALRSTARMSGQIRKLDDDDAFNAIHAKSWRDAKATVSRALVAQKVNEQQWQPVASWTRVALVDVAEEAGTAASATGLPPDVQDLAERVLQLVQKQVQAGERRLDASDVCEALSGVYNLIQQRGTALLYGRVLELNPQRVADSTASGDDTEAGA